MKYHHKTLPLSAPQSKTCGQGKGTARTRVRTRSQTQTNLIPMNKPLNVRLLAMPRTNRLVLPLYLAMGGGAKSRSLHFSDNHVEILQHAAEIVF
ncbi:hypothetical protein PC118_g19537 [Phytophthora cactorum]|uniref:Uncharacterized protein n=1 Tax=Phytophthora cactorum TaxID=29920 RepID=A0A8T1F884_9STRA|nr:hypothetical protein PC118_g19537 [Phytophthora cactorum]